MSEFVKKYQLDTRTYTPKGFHGVLYYFFIIGEIPGLAMQRQYGDSYPLTLYFGTDGLGKWYWDDAEMLRIGRVFLEKTLQDPAHLDELIKKWLKVNRTFQRTYRGLTSESVSRWSDEELVERMMRFYHAYGEQFGIAIGVQDPFSMRAEALWQDRFRVRLQDQFDTIFPQLVVASQFSFAERERLDRLKILRTLQRRRAWVEMVRSAIDGETVRAQLPQIWARLERHAATYFFVSNNYAVVDHLNAEYFLKKIQEDLRNGVVAKEDLTLRAESHKRALANKATLIEQWDFSSDERLLLHIADRFSWQQDERKKFMMIANHYLSLFLHEVSRRTGIDEALLKQSHPKELVEVLLHDVRKEEEWRAREDFCVCVNTKDGYELLSGQAAREVHEQLFPEPEKMVQEFKGMVASQGVARGIVKIVLKRDDVSHVASGSVVVASMTRPEMVPAMQRACAIITDEGGVTSHAAIVSRELKKPCIIGTKIATKVLKDGDEVEVNANVGVVRILKRAS